MDNTLRAYLAELVGTFLLVLVGAGTVCAADLTGLPYMGVVGLALAEGFTLAAVLTVTFHVSTGCLNPAITIMLWVFKRLDNVRAGWLILMQLLGATLAGLVLRLMFSEEVLHTTFVGAPHLSGKAFAPATEGIGAPQLVSGTAFELFLTCLVTLAAFATLFDRRAPRLGGLVVGLTQSAAVLFGYFITGGAANPARWFGPAVWEATVGLRPSWLAEAVIYIGGPILGALLAAVLYVNLILPPEKGTDSLR